MRIVDLAAAPMAHESRDRLWRSPLLLTTFRAIRLDTAQHKATRHRPSQPLLSCRCCHAQQRSQPFERHIAGFLDIGHSDSLIESIEEKLVAVRALIGLRLGEELVEASTNDAHMTPACQLAERCHHPWRGEHRKAWARCSGELLSCLAGRTF